MLIANQLTKTFGAHTALHALDLRVRPGEIFCLLGANGAGKSTTLKLLLGLIAPDSGTASIDGVDVHRDPGAARRRLLYIPETVALYDELTGLENLAYFAGLGQLEDRSESRLKSCLAEAGLISSAFDRRVSTYSKGMRQKVGIALAIAKQAKVLLLDEPTSGLDPVASAEFHALVTRQRDKGAAVLMATHDLFRAREIGTSIGLMREGRLRRVLPAASLTTADLESIYIEEMGIGVED
jgi:ABC-2 type transport system ATP-binding protein